MTTRIEARDRNEKTRPERYSRNIDETGATDIDILNTLGRDQKAQRNKLYQQALKDPDKYMAARDEAVERIIDDQVREIYNKFKQLLKYGKMGSKGAQMHFPDTTDYQPMLPDASIQKFCLGVSETIEDMCEKAFEEIYPRDHKDLAIKKISDLNKTGL